MSRSGYTDDYDFDQWQLIMYRGAVASATRGKRGQQLFRDLLAALDAMPVKELVAEALETADGEVCALGALGKARGLDLSDIDPEEYERVARKFDIADSLAREIAYENDEGAWVKETPTQRWTRMREWVAKQIRQAPDPEAP